MAEKKITRKVISKVPLKEEVSKEEKVSKVEEAGLPQETSRPKKSCFYCQSKTNPSYTDVVSLRRFITDRVKIVARAKSNLCSKHQRAVARQIKYARHLALLPFVPKV